MEAGSNLLTIARGDIVLIDRNQANFARDGTYLLDFPGIELRGLFRRPDGKVDVIGPASSLVTSVGELLGLGHPRAVSKVVGRAVLVGRAM